MNKPMTALIAIGIASGAMAINSGRSQDSGVSTNTSSAPRLPSRQNSASVSVSGVSGASNSSNGNSTSTGGDPAIAAIRSEIKQLTDQLRQAVDEPTKADLAKQLETAVSKYFDEDLKIRESQLSKLEARVTNLRSQLERRRKAKGDITQLQTKVLINDADGLGFSGASLLDDHNPPADKAREVVNRATPVAPSLPAR
ncbi:MAG TPA: hypothetical protein VFE46_03585 [Pirellulales bacterium]|jgi:hypothetical protein|nr:hypothetical protein [Pirellulales bacterium]